LVLASCAENPPAISPQPSSVSSASPSATSASGECHGSFAKERPAGWVEVGKLVVVVKDEMPIGYELHDTAGKKVDSGDVDIKTARAAGDYVAGKICKIGGVLAIYDAKAGEGGQMVTTVVKPAREDEPGDLATLCKEPAGMASLDDAQKRRAAFDAYEALLTSSKWRSWLFDVYAKLHKAHDDARPAVMAEGGDSLAKAAAAANIKDCWFAASLRKR
jgi:hypothetical protein